MVTGKPSKALGGAGPMCGLKLFQAGRKPFAEAPIRVNDVATLGENLEDLDLIGLTPQDEDPEASNDDRLLTLHDTAGRKDLRPEVTIQIFDSRCDVHRR
jgi:hypothetical protein